MSGARQAHAVPYRSNRYIAAAAAHLGMAEQELFDRMDGFACGGCGAIYFDPWLSPAFARQLYHRIFPHHNLGWYEFYHVAATPAAVRQRQTLAERLRGAVPALQSYAEVGCPFEGLLPYFGMRTYRDGAREFLDYPGRIRLDDDVGRNPDVRGNAVNLERIGRACANGLNRLQLARAFPPSRWKERWGLWRGTAQEVARHDVRAVFLEQESSGHWGPQCQSLGVQCLRMAEQTLGCGAARLAETASDRGTFDLIGVFNVLDHYLRPLDLLRDLLQRTRFVYVEGHRKADAGKQHPFLLSEEVFSRLPLPGVSRVREFAGTGDPETFSVLLRAGA